MIAGMMGSPDNPMLGWAVHFMIGIVGYGIAITLLAHRFGSSATVSGIIIGVIGWLVMMVMLMPMAGAGMFGMAMGVMAPVMTLVLHIISARCSDGHMASSSRAPEPVSRSRRQILINGFGSIRKAFGGRKNPLISMGNVVLWIVVWVHGCPYVK